MGVNGDLAFGGAPNIHMISNLSPVVHYTMNGLLISTPSLCTFGIMVFALSGWCGVGIEVNLTPFQIVDVGRILHPCDFVW